MDPGRRAVQEHLRRASRRARFKITNPELQQAIAAAREELRAATATKADQASLGVAAGRSLLVIGRVALSLQKPLVCDLYDANPGTGAFVLIDEATHHTVAAGMIRAFSA